MAKQDSKPKRVEVNTDKQIEALKPADKRREVSVKNEPGLFVRVTPAGEKYFVWYTRNGHGDRRTFSLGKFGLDTLNMRLAKSKVATYREEKDRGVLFKDEPGIPRTVGELAERYYTKRILPHNTAPETTRQVLDHDVLPAIGNVKLVHVNERHVNDIIEAALERGAKVHAGKIFNVVRQMFRYAKGMGYLSRNPAADQNKKDLGIPTVKPRERCLTHDEIKAFYDAMEKAERMSQPVRHALRILLLSGVRSGELINAHWEHIDYEAGTWFIPAENDKNKAGWTVPLSSHLITQFKAIEAYYGGYTWVLGGKKRLGERTFRRNIENLFIYKYLDIEKFNPHDLRRTMRTELTNMRVPPHVAEKCLNHSLGKIYETYDKGDYLEERLEVLEDWGDRLEMIVNGDSNVTVFQKTA